MRLALAVARPSLPDRGTVGPWDHVSEYEVAFILRVSVHEQDVHPSHRWELRTLQRTSLLPASNCPHRGKDFRQRDDTS